MSNEKAPKNFGRSYLENCLFIRFHLFYINYANHILAELILNFRSKQLFS